MSGATAVCVNEQLARQIRECGCRVNPPRGYVSDTMPSPKHVFARQGVGRRGWFILSCLFANGLFAKVLRRLSSNWSDECVIRMLLVRGVVSATSLF